MSATKYLDNEGLSHFWGKIKDRISESVQTISGKFESNSREISQAVDEPAGLYATQIIYLDQAGYEALEEGSRPSSSHWEYAGSGSSSILVHDSSSFTTLPVDVESTVQVPYAIALSTGTNEYASSYKLKPLSMMDWPYGGAVKISDLLAAGESGVKLTFTGSGDPYGNDDTLDIYASFSSLAEDPTNPPPYVVSYSARKDAVTEEVLTAKIYGKDGSGETTSSVDVSPLLNYIGGKVEKVTAGDSEMLSLVDPDNPGVEPPFYFCHELPFFSSNGSGFPTVSVFSDGVLTVSFPASSPEPEAFIPIFYYGDPSDPGLVYGKMDSSTGMPARFPLETALAGPLMLDELDLSSNSPAPTGNTVSLITERVEGDVPAYRFTLYSGSVEIKKVLHLYPSCDNAIDLSGLIRDITDYQGATSSASGVAGLVPSALSEEKDRFLKGDGTWGEINLSHSVSDISGRIEDNQYVPVEVTHLVEDRISTYENAEIISNSEIKVLKNQSGVDNVYVDIIIFADNDFETSYTFNIPYSEINNAAYVNGKALSSSGIEIFEGTRHISVQDDSPIHSLYLQIESIEDDYVVLQFMTLGFNKTIKLEASYSDNTSKNIDIDFSFLGNGLVKEVKSYLRGDRYYQINEKCCASKYRLVCVNPSGWLENYTAYESEEKNRYANDVEESSEQFEIPQNGYSGFYFEYEYTDEFNADRTHHFSIGEDRGSNVIPFSELPPQGETSYFITNRYSDESGSIEISDNSDKYVRFNITNIDGTHYELQVHYSYYSDLVLSTAFTDANNRTINLITDAKHTHSFEDLTIDVYNGATESSNGIAGLVPVATSLERNNFLRGDGTWAEITLPSTLTATEVQTGTDTAGKLISAKVLHDYATASNTDTKVNVTLGTTTKAYLLGTSTTPTSTASGVTAISDTGVYLDTTAGRLTATSFAGNVENGTLATANAVVVTNASKKLTASTTITTTELGYLDGVTSSIQTQLNGKAASSHNQASNTINAMTGYSKPSSTSAIGTSDTLNAAIGKLEKALDGKQASGNYASASHNHDASNINSGTLDAARIPGLDASKIASGTIDIARLPAGALPILKVVGNETERFALTSSDVQVGDTVQQTDTGLMYYVKDVSKLNSADGYAVYTAGAATSVPWSGVTSKPSTYAPSAHNQASNTINAMTGYSKPSSTSAIGTSDTLNAAIGKLEKALDSKQASGSYAAASHNHASNEVTAMTSYSKPSSTSAIAATDTLNAAIGKLEKALDGKAASSHGTHVTYSTSNPLVAGTASAGTANNVSRGDHVHPEQTTVKQAKGIFLVIPNQTAQSATLTATVDGITEYFPGLTIAYRAPFNTAASSTLNINNLGAKPIYYKVNTTSKDYYPANSVVLLVYETTTASGGCWKMVYSFDGNTNYYDRRLHSSAIKAAAAVTSGTIIVGTSAGYKTAASGVTFDIQYPVLYASGAIASAATATNTYEAIAGVNLQTTKASWTGTQYSVVYLVGTMSGTTVTIDSSIFTTTIPSSADGKVYIPIGVLYSTYQVYFAPTRDIYQYTNGSFHLLDTTTAVAGSSNGQVKINGTDVTVYTHPTTSGSKHVPSGGSSGQFLGWSADGTAAWVNNPNANSTTHIYAGASSTATSNASSATSNTATYIVICDDSTARNAVQIAGSNGTTVSAANGVLTIDSPALAAVATSQIDTLFA